MKMEVKNEWIIQMFLDIWKVIARYAYPKHMYVIVRWMRNPDYYMECLYQDDIDLWIEMGDKGASRIFKARYSGEPGKVIFILEDGRKVTPKNIARIEDYEFPPLEIIAYGNESIAEESANILTELYPALDFEVRKVRVNSKDVDYL